MALRLASVTDVLRNWNHKTFLAAIIYVVHNLKKTVLCMLSHYVSKLLTSLSTGISGRI